jgi:hypothetical protein
MKLPFNDGDSVLRAAQKFCDLYDIGRDNLDTIQNHIRQNSKNLPFDPNR